MESIIGAENPMQQRGRRAPGGGNNPPPPPLHKCPRCDSHHTKFCYYNNYSITQPRYYCKSCRRYWTQGGTLRNVPIGGGCRKNKRATIRSPSLRPPGSSPAVRPSNLTAVANSPPMGGPFYAGGSFLPSLAAMQPSGQGAAGLNLAAPGGQFGGNMALLHGVSLPLKNPAAAHHFEPPPTSHYFPPLSSAISPEFTPWSQGFVNTGGSTSSSAAASNGWNTGGAGKNQAGTFAPHQWTDNHQGFNPSQ